MNEQINEPAVVVPKASKDNTLEDVAQTVDVEGIMPARVSYDQMTSDVGKIYGSAFSIAQNGAKVLGEKLLDNTERNSEAIFAAAKAVVRCRDVSEVAKVQSDFVQTQLALAGQQVREFYQLSTMISKETVEAAQAAARKAVSELKDVR
ncbi:MAG: phasin family protein [Methyloligellaceae bacterium]